MSVRLLACTFAFGVIGIVSACGGASDSGLFGGTAGGGNGDSGSSVDGGGSHDGAVVGDPDGSVGIDAGPRDGATAHDSSTTPDTGPPVDVVKCEGSSGCKVGTDSCCWNQQQQTHMCVPLGSCNGGQTVEIPCDKARDCDLLGSPGDVCCVTGGATVASDVSCAPAASCTAAQNATRMCDPQMSGACVLPLTCQLSQQTIQGYFICR